MESKISVIETKDYDLIKSVILNPVLFNLTYGQGQTTEEYTVDTSFQHLAIYENDILAGVIEVKPFTKITLEVHINILPAFQGTDFAKRVAETGHIWAIENGYQKTMTRVPSNCAHVLRFMKRINYNFCGVIKNSIMYNGHLVSLYLFEYDLLAVKRG